MSNRRHTKTYDGDAKLFPITYSNEWLRRLGRDLGPPVETTSDKYTAIRLNRDRVFLFFFSSKKLVLTNVFFLFSSKSLLRPWVKRHGDEDRPLLLKIHENNKGLPTAKDNITFPLHPYAINLIDGFTLIEHRHIVWISEECLSAGVVGFMLIAFTRAIILRNAKLRVNCKGNSAEY